MLYNVCKLVVSGLSNVGAVHVVGAHVAGEGVHAYMFACHMKRPACQHSCHCAIHAALSQLEAYPANPADCAINLFSTVQYSTVQYSILGQGPPWR
jgi:hypothetical protein